MGTSISPAGVVANVPPGNVSHYLEGCLSTDVLVTTCGRTENNWVYYDYFPGSTCPSTLDYTLLAGDNQVLQEGCTEVLPANIQMYFECPPPTAMPSGSPSAIPSSSAMPSSEPSSVPSSESSSMPSSEPSSMPSSEPSSVPLNTTCYDLKEAYQLSSCCNSTATRAATFDNLGSTLDLTCGDLISSYKGSSCCSAELSNVATLRR